MVTDSAAGSVASGSVASGSVASGSVASGSVASGSVASGSVASGSVVASTRVRMMDSKFRFLSEELVMVMVCVPAVSSKVSGRMLS